MSKPLLPLPNSRAKLVFDVFYIDPKEESKDEEVLDPFLIQAKVTSQKLEKQRF